MVIGMTGGVGAGKSTILNILKENYSAHLLITDDIAKHLTEPGNESYNLIVGHFGPGILDREGNINSPALAAIVFDNPDELALLNSYTHPQVAAYVDEHIQKIKEENPSALIVIESALLFSSGLDKKCDYIWAVITDFECRVKRLAESRGYSREKTKSVTENQMSDEELSARADFVINNSGSIDDVKAQIKTFFNDLKQNNRYF